MGIGDYFVLERSGLLLLWQQEGVELLKNGGEWLTKERGEWDWIAASASAKHLYCYSSGEAIEQTCCSILLLILFHPFFNKKELLLRAVSVVALAGT